METTHKSSSHVQMHAEDILFQKIAALLDISLERTPKIFLADNAFTYMQPDFYSAADCILRRPTAAGAVTNGS